MLATTCAAPPCPFARSRRLPAATFGGGYGIGRTRRSTRPRAPRRAGVVRCGLLPVDPWAPTMDSQSVASQLFAVSLFPYLGFLYFMTRSKTAPGLTLFGFYFLLAFVGATRPWMTCGRGLRQGDALSPYLFLLVADVLETLIKNNRAIRHPLSDDGPCAVLQYADDTIVVVRADSGSAQQLKKELDSFAAATGLAINFTKSTVTPMNVDEGRVNDLVNILHCLRGSFPQTYLGLPLSNTKLQLSAFAPLIAKVDRYLAGTFAKVPLPQLDHCEDVTDISG
ncbi:unnamed protein product [Miscanthus lutarioriparius]|uniref:Reverse transcriptase domain-containing protein n=1 Tax=Miscanthus lutarioriparius TaxID=422564 RepID=A0A811RUN4_9POAL|nr:unnamed protein product [Miscanthus lutarioriparius]